MFTVTNIAGYAHYLGLTIEMVTSILLILCCGLALDYSAHIGVAYATSRARRRGERAHEALVSLGAPVFHGGISTFLAISLLCFTGSYIFITFFTVGVNFNFDLNILILSRSYFPH